MDGIGFLSQIPMFYCPTEMIIPTKTYQCPLRKTEQQMKLPNGEGFTYEIAAVRNCLLKGKLMILSECWLINWFISQFEIYL